MEGQRTRAKLLIYTTTNTLLKRWRGIVKARHLVLAVHEYFVPKYEDQQYDVFEALGAPRINENDAWTLEYMDLMHVQPIIEAFDDDASGFITVQEVNQFTTSRPKGWR